MIVFDSSALIAWSRSRGETGTDFVRELLDEADVPKFVHTANLCEVYHLTWRLEEEQGGDGQAKAVRPLAVSIFDKRTIATLSKQLRGEHKVRPYIGFNKAETIHDAEMVSALSLR